MPREGISEGWWREAGGSGSAGNGIESPDSRTDRHGEKAWRLLQDHPFRNGWVRLCASCWCQLQWMPCRRKKKYAWKRCLSTPEFPPVSWVLKVVSVRHSSFGIRVPAGRSTFRSAGCSPLFAPCALRLALRVPLSPCPPLLAPRLLASASVPPGRAALCTVGSGPLTPDASRLPISNCPVVPWCVVPSFRTA
jgi:hypothetical protein